MAALRILAEASTARGSTPRALVALFVFHGAIQVLVIGTGMLHLPLSSAGAWGIGLIALGASTAAFRYSPAAEYHSPSSVAARCWTALCLIVLGLYGILAWVKIDPSFDGNWYHIPVIHFWAAKGYVHWVDIEPHATWFIMGLDYMNGYPNAHEVTSFWLARVAGDGALNAASLLYLPLGALGAYVVCRALGATSAWGAFGAFLYVLLPVNIAQVHTTYVDSSFGACVIGLLALMAMVHDRSRNGAAPRVLMLSIGIALGLIVGIKGNGPLLAILAGIFIAGNLLGASRGVDKQSRKRYIHAAASGLALIVLAALATGGYWNLRNWYFGGSPVYPIGITIGGVELFPGEPFEKIVNTRGQTPPEMRDWPAWKQVAHTWMQGQSLDRWHGALGDYASRFGGLSYLWLLGALPASLLLALRAVWRRIRKQSNNATPARYLFLFSFVLVAFLLTPNNWWARYTVWIFGIGLPAFICCAARPMPWRALSVPKWCWILVCCGVFFYEAGLTAMKVSNATPPFWKPTEGTTYWKPPADSPYARMLAEPDAPVTLYNVITRRQSILGTLCQPIGVRPVYFLSEEDAAHPATLENFIRERGIRYLIAGEKGGQPAGIGTLAPEKQFARLWNLNVYAVKSP